MNMSFYKNKRVFITGHTGFKGSWMCRLLMMSGADVTGYALEPPTEPSLFEVCNIRDGMNSITGDIRDLEHMKRVFKEVQPEIVIHMAAQPLVRESYKNPVCTYETNVMGTVNILECIRMSSYVKSFFSDREIAVSTCRAGNVIGGGDFAKDRIIPDCIRAVEEGRDIIVRNPFSIRPYQHVLEPVSAYLMIAQRQYMEKKTAGNYNVGPDDSDCWTTGELVDLFCKKWKDQTGIEAKWIDKSDGGPYEAGFLKLDCAKIKSVFGWKPVWNVEKAMEKIVEWSECYLKNGSVDKCMEMQTKEFCAQIQYSGMEERK